MVDNEKMTKALGKDAFKIMFSMLAALPVGESYETEYGSITKNTETDFNIKVAEKYKSGIEIFNTRSSRDTVRDMFDS